MITIIVAIINSKYDTGYEALFVGTVVLDIILMMCILGIVG